MPGRPARPTSAAGTALTENTEVGNGDVFAAVILTAALVVLAAAVGRWLMRRLGQPTVLGELLAGIAVGNFGYWLGLPLFVVIMHLGQVEGILNEVWASGRSIAEATRAVFPPGELGADGLGARLDAVLVGPGGPTLVVTGIALWLFSNLGVLFLLFMAGMDSNVEEMRRLGARPVAVAVAGVIAPFALGLAATAWLMPDAPHSVHLFVAATLCATSIGITARVFEDLGKLETPEAAVTLGAAVIDDVLGLILLAVVVGLVAEGEVRVASVLWIVGLALLFFGVLIAVGDRLAEWGLRLFRRLDRPNYKLIYPVILMLVLAWLANSIGLAAIVGAFAAGLLLHGEQYAEHIEGGLTIRDEVHPLEAVFAPVFFILMGMQVDLAALLDPEAVRLALFLVAAAVLGKLAAGLAAGPRADRLAVGVGMIPRGEVGLIFASVGRGLGVVDEALFSAIVLVVIVTTLITPPGLTWALGRRARAPTSKGGAPLR